MNTVEIINLLIVSFVSLLFGADVGYKFGRIAGKKELISYQDELINRLTNN